MVLHFAAEVVIHGLNHGGVELLGAQTVAAADHLDIAAPALEQRGEDVLVQRLAQGTGLLGAVEHGDLFAAGGNGVHQALGAEGTVEADFDEAQLLALGVEVVDGFLDGFAAAAHGHDDAVGVGRAHVLEQLVFAAHQLANLGHDFLDDVGGGVVELVGGFAVLEVDVRVLRGAHLMRMLGVERAGAEGLNLVPRHQGRDFVVIKGVDFLHLVAGAEAVEEMQEGNAGLQGAQVRDQAQIHGFLHTVGGQQRKAGLTAGHHVGMVAENGQRMRSQRTGADMEDAGQEFAGDLIHVGDHQQEALAGGEGGRERAGGQAAVHGARRARLGLHLAYMYGLAEEVLRAAGRPFVHDLRHGAGRSDGVNGRHVAKRIRNVAYGGITVDCHLGCH